jgi:IS5 family transposase
MIVDRYAPVNLFALLPALQMKMEPELAQLDRLLEDEEIFLKVKADMACRAPLSLLHGRRSTPVEVVLRMLIVRKLYGFSYEQTEYFISDSLVLRQFCRLYMEPAPDDTTLIRWANLIEPQTLERLNERVVALARSRKVTRGRKLRSDGTVVETTIHYPTDSSLLSDGVRVIGRLLKRAKRLRGVGVREAREIFRNRSRSAKRLTRRIAEASRQRANRPEGLEGPYRKLLAVARATLRQAKEVRQRLAGGIGQAAPRLADHIEGFARLLERVVQQASRRVFEGQQVSAAEKVVSLFEPHTAIICRGKAATPTEFGRKLWLDEVEGGLISG